jgi:hypothetical protein
MPFFEAIMHAASTLQSTPSSSSQQRAHTHAGNPYFSAGTGLIGVGAGMAALRGTLISQ